MYALAKAGNGSMVDYLAFLHNYQNEDDYSVVSDISANLSGLETALADQPYADKLKKISLEIFRPIKAKLGWDPKPDDTHLTQLFRALVISRLSSCDDEETVAEAKVPTYIPSTSARMPQHLLLPPLSESCSSVGALQSLPG